MIDFAPAASRENARALVDTEVAKLIRLELKAAFPAVKFSVRCTHSVRISYTNGPTVDRVEAIVSKFEGKQFDGMTDSTSYKPPFSYNGEWVYTYCYVFVSRELSPALVERIATAVANYYEISKPAIVAGFVRPTVEEDKAAWLRTGTDWGTAIYRAARDRSSVCRAGREARAL